MGTGRERRSANPRGIFDRSSAGATLEPISVAIERGRIRFSRESSARGTVTERFEVDGEQRARVAVAASVQDGRETLVGDAAIALD